MTYAALAVVARALYRVMGWHIAVSGLRHVPAAGPMIVACNHVSQLDPVHLGLAVYQQRRRLAFMAKRELFTTPVLGTMLRWAEQIEVDRAGHAGAAIQPALAVLRSGGGVAIFPEGTISTSFVPGPPHIGVGRLATETGACVIPAAVWGGQRVVTKGHRDLRCRGVLMTVSFGKPIVPGPGEDAGHLTARTWEAVSGLVEVACRHYPQRPADPGGVRWMPAHLGGAAPEVAKAVRHELAEDVARRAAWRATAARRRQRTD